MNSSPSDLLIRHAPELGEPNEDILASVRRGARHSGRRQPRGGALPRRLGYAVTAIAASTALAFGVQSVLHRPPAASAVERLAEAAGKQPATEVPAGSYLYQSYQFQSREDRAGNDSSLFEWWIDAEGRVWWWTTLPNGDHENPWTPYGIPEFPVKEGEVPSVTLTPRELNKLPTDPADLIAAFKKDPNGNPLGDGDAFGGIVMAIAWGGTTGAFNKGAIQALAMIPDTTIRLTSDAESRPCLEIGYPGRPDPEVPYQSACFDQETGRLLELVGELGVFEEDAEAGGYTFTFGERKIDPSLPPELAKISEDARTSTKDVWDLLPDEVGEDPKS